MSCGTVLLLVVGVQAVGFGLYGLLMSLAHEVNWVLLGLGWLVAAALVVPSASLGIAIHQRARTALIVAGIALLSVCAWSYASPPLVLRLHPSWNPWAIAAAIGMSLLVVTLITALEQRSCERSPAEWFPRYTFAIASVVLVALHLFHQFIFLLINHLPPANSLAGHLWIVALGTWSTLTIMWTLGSAAALAVLLPHAFWKLTRDPAPLTNANLALLSVAIAVLISAAWDQSKPSGVEEAEYAPFGVGTGPFATLRYLGGRMWP